MAGGLEELYNADGVAAFVEIVKKAGSKFTVRSSGYHSNSGHNSVGESGVVMDVRNLKSMSVDDNGAMNVGAG
ncbi:hypothetical protein GGS23DRAFT_592447 [Durotheca rogersii]|uniref:uncharacterized protein n=1 Tax=Durotheca rogersii TaxID=419775 RepID=UPI002220C58F|nr:uncharacterized protein GGS23DRAFT_592447 [Durotheca rogersii]KAI5868693.1 hypothetical protein GGS23DRAFT_592447 [Durotheca rogersii]